jgi:ABC-2 type transport system permease protein
MFILQMINAIMTIALVLVPQLIMVEKERHTLDALLVSPASLPDMIIGKGLVGVFYATIAVLIVILLNTKFVAHWPLLIVSTLSGIVFSVLVGLLIGLIFENFQQATLAMSLIVMIAIGPAFIKLIVTANLPRILDLIVNWLPSGQLANLLLMSLMKSVEKTSVLLGMGAIWAANLIVFGLNLWKIRQHSNP